MLHDFNVMKKNRQASITINFKPIIAALSVLLSTSLTFAGDHDGGGSSTGGGHGRVCLSHAAAVKAQAIFNHNHLPSSLFVDPYGDGREADIKSVTLIEGDNVAKMLSRDNTGVMDPIGPSVFSFLQKSLSSQAKEMEEHSGYSPELRSFISSAITDFIKRMDWKSAAHGLTLTSDFEIPEKNAADCVYAQLAKQTWLSKDHVLLMYDQKLLAKLPQQDGSFLALHEAMYHLVMASPNYARLGHPSMFVRKLTTYIALSQVVAYHSWLPNHVLEMLHELGYLPNLNKGTPDDYPLESLDDHRLISKQVDY